MDLNEARDRLIIGVEDTAVWRALKARQYPRNKINGEATKLLWGLAESLRSQSINSLLTEVAAFWSAAEFDLISTFTSMELKFTALEFKIFAEIEFHRTFRNAEDFLRELIAGYTQIRSEAMAAQP